MIRDYPTEIKVSDSRRACYWTKVDHDKSLTPKKYRDAARFGFDVDGIMIDLSTKERVVKNVKTVGKPRMLTINAQKIYVGIHHSVRSKIVNELHTLFNSAFKQQLPGKIDTTNKKILISLHFYDVYTTKLPDLDNLANLFVKCGIDCLTTVNNPNQVKGISTTHKLGILPDDKMIFIPHITMEFTEVSDPKDRKLDFCLYEVTADFSVEKLLDDALNANPFSIGEKVVCDRADHGLTLGKTYIVTNISYPDFIGVINDLGKEDGHPFRIFHKLE